MTQPRANCSEAVASLSTGKRRRYANAALVSDSGMALQHRREQAL